MHNRIRSAVKRAEFVNDCIIELYILYEEICGDIALYVHALTDD
jgi:hypothetical protein